MFLSKLILNPRDRQVRSDLARPYEMHRTLWNRFPSLRGIRPAAQIWIASCSASMPTDTAATLLSSCNRTSNPTGRVSRPATSLSRSSRLSFHSPSASVSALRAPRNPTKKIGSASKSERLAGVRKNGKRVALFHENDQIAWLVEKGQHGGFSIPGQWREENGVPFPNFRVDVVSEGWVRCGKDGHRDGEFLAVRFDGVLTVTDPAAFCKTLIAGIGSAKGFGFGLLSIARAEGMP